MSFKSSELVTAAEEHSSIVVTSADVHVVVETATQLSVPAAAEVPEAHASQAASVVAVAAFRRVAAAASPTAAWLPQVGVECASQSANASDPVLS